MRFDLDNLPADPALLQQLVRDLAEVVERQKADLAELEALRQQLRQMQRTVFGRRSERLDADQLDLGLDDLEADIARVEAKLATDSLDTAPEPAEATEGREGRGRDWPDHLPLHDVIMEPEGLDAAAGVCPCCGDALHAAGETIARMVDYVPAQVRVLRIRRPKYACRGCGTLHQASAPDKPAAKGMATPAMLAHVITSRYCDHLPFYRQAQILARNGFPVDRSVLARWAGQACWWLETVQEELAKAVFASAKLFADDTPMPTLAPGTGRVKTGRFWAYARDDRPWQGTDPPAVVYAYTSDRKGERPAGHLRDFHGVLQVDGYAGFERLAAGNRVVLAACWSHARRRFYDLAENGSPIAAEALRRIARLYAIEERIRGRTADERRQVRQAESAPQVADLKLWLERELPRLPGRSKLAEAIRYALGRWKALCVYLDDGRVEMDTNTVERCIRPVALSRKNSLFAGSEGGGHRWAVIASLVETCKLNDVEPFAYLRDILERMVNGYPASRIADLLPWNWKPAVNS
ncbi:IS66 family transposase [Azospirillum brasilense]|uniref:IS66 family transposase n=1 Tax=Azospirillum brasilense TaxID=192 RepID=UPI000E67D85F|nr:IS66 family transposase [Azospirillum brasilense]NUB29709.1 IS66 family transposase [Azospirillum brasilense]NUB36311.1 IS66 family transposase [Azospirillum brasilense]RIV97303.1 IS66 family transposase [Azospirillum brasilense]